MKSSLYRHWSQFCASPPQVSKDTVSAHGAIAATSVEGAMLRGLQPPCEVIRPCPCHALSRPSWPPAASASALHQQLLRRQEHLQVPPKSGCAGQRRRLHGFNTVAATAAATAATVWRGAFAVHAACTAAAINAAPSQADILPLCPCTREKLHGTAVARACFK